MCAHLDSQIPKVKPTIFQPGVRRVGCLPLSMGWFIKIRFAPKSSITKYSYVKFYYFNKYVHDNYFRCRGRVQFVTVVSLKHWPDLLECNFIYKKCILFAF